ncbi:Transcriptional regulatory protein CusR [Botrimarina colliarenosi]|uniref:Transcriptional regulatory protein CusR n=1 Tax=Botrimarina colliarenosi TaxID=2528001 RepID=A0A5C6AGZ5_9BACT|nr:response regulator [Botrimarina colliarenosi]TWT99312.1 Transcriptional regulatory protein CusR [Botrimarina colliarenosi]
MTLIAPTADAPAKLYGGEAPAKSSRPKRRRRPPSRGRLLWVDDDANVTAAMTRRFRRKGYEVVPASDGMQGYWLAVTRKPDLIITDLRMPRWEGRDLLECLLHNSATMGVPLIVVSGYITPEERRRLERMGVAAAFDKPVEWRTLLTTVRDLLHNNPAGLHNNPA